MPAIRIYRHPGCATCARYARVHRALDWLGRVETSTATPPGRGPLRLGEVVVERLATGALLAGAEAAEAIARAIPAYRPFRPLLRVPAVRRWVEVEMAGCDGDACAVPGGPARPGSARA